LNPIKTTSITPSSLTLSFPSNINRAAIKSSLEGGQFSCSQSAVNESDPQWQNALDIKIPDFSISAHRKELFHNSSLNIAHGRVSEDTEKLQGGDGEGEREGVL
jgi:hypothetical protein